MSRFLTIAVAAFFAQFALDYYVFRNWRRFALRRKALRWTVVVYRVSMVLMPLVLPVYFYLSRWWEVEPKLLRAAAIGVWSVYYIPKVIIALVLAMKDAGRFATWLFRRLQRTSTEKQEADGHDLSDAVRMSRAEFIRKVGWSAAGVPFVLVGYSLFRTLYNFEVYRIDVPIVGLPRALDGLTIAQISDLHAGSLFSRRPMQETVDTVLAHRPDLITITGDFVNHDEDEMGIILPDLRRLHADLGVFACLGNHDHYANVDAVIRQVRETPVDLLVNAHHSLAIDGAHLHLIGTDNTGFNQHYADLDRARAGIEPSGDELLLLLAHDPTYWDAVVRPEHPDIDLMLCGHTHGGQIGLELGPVRWSLAQVAYPRWAGYYREPASNGMKTQHLYVNRGIGTVGPPVRLGIRPEITFLTLRSKVKS